MTDTPPVDTAPSTPLPSGGDTPENREQFARATATALGEWCALEDWQRRAIGATAPALARALYLADLTVDAMLDQPADEVTRAEIIAACAMLPEPDELLARLGLCTATIALPDEGLFVTCGTPLVGGRCPFAAHHAPPPVAT
jgi:hypothetical protein